MFKKIHWFICNNKKNTNIFYVNIRIMFSKSKVGPTLTLLDNLANL